MRFYLRKCCVCESEWMCPMNACEIEPNIRMGKCKFFCAFFPMQTPEKNWNNRQWYCSFVWVCATSVTILHRIFPFFLCCSLSKYMLDCIFYNALAWLPSRSLSLYLCAGLFHNRLSFTDSHILQCFRHDEKWKRCFQPMIGFCVVAQLK